MYKYFKSILAHFLIVELELMSQMNLSMNQ